MMSLLNQFADGWYGWQISMLWQVAILIIIVAAGDFVLRRWAWPQVRYALWLLILVKLVLPPSLTSPASFTAEIPVAIQQTLTYTDGNTDLRGQTQNPNIEIRSISELPKSEIQNAKMDSHFRGNDSGEGIASPTARNDIDTPARAAGAKSVVSWKVYALCVWALGAFILTLWLVLRLHSLRKEHLKCESKLPKELEELLQATAQKVGLKKVPQIILTNKICCPAVFGVFQPVLLLPANKLKEMTAQDIEHIFLHELSHIKRGDLLVHAAYMILQIAYWFNPLLWIIRKHIQNLRELCCDAAVARILKEKTAAYRETLLETARRLVAEPVDPGLGLLGLFENSGRLIDRLRWLEKKSWKYRGLRIATVFILICVMSACVLPMAKFEAKADFVVKGRVTDAQTAEPIANAKVGDVNEYADGKFFAVTDSNGDYSYQTYYEEHNIKCAAAGYQTANETLLTKLLGSEKEKVINFQLAAEKNAAAETQSREDDKNNLAAESSLTGTSADAPAGDTETVKNNTERKDFSIKLSDGKTSLRLAVMGNHQDTVEMLISKGADVNAKDSDGNTPLHLAASNGSPEMCKFLIEKGADINAKNIKGRTPLDLASARGHRETAELLIARGAKVKPEKRNTDVKKARSLRIAIYEGDMNEPETSVRIPLAAMKIIRQFIPKKETLDKIAKKLQADKNLPEDMNSTILLDTFDDMLKKFDEGVESTTLIEVKDGDEKVIVELE